jgi:eukaryotic-like serine/threonine-protein kinase
VPGAVLRAAYTPGRPGVPGRFDTAPIEPLILFFVPASSLATTVLAYYAAINQHHYARAWRLGGRNTGETCRAFVSGFAGTANDAVTIQSVSGDVVTAQLVAEQTDGTVKTYQGSYTVEGGVITEFNVKQVS